MVTRAKNRPILVRSLKNVCVPSISYGKGPRNPSTVLDSRDRPTVDIGKIMVARLRVGPFVGSGTTARIRANIYFSTRVTFLTFSAVYIVGYMKTQSLEPRYIIEMPSELQEGVLYISKQCHVAIHLCACGCGQQTVTPFGKDGWELTDNNGLVSLHPSIGNQQFECHSHYWVKENKVVLQ